MQEVKTKPERKREPALETSLRKQSLRGMKAQQEAGDLEQKHNEVGAAHNASFRHPRHPCYSAPVRGGSVNRAACSLALCSPGAVV